MEPPTETTVFVLCPGSFSPASFYHKVTAILESKGYKAYETDLLSVNDGTGPSVSMYEDAAHINSVIANLADQGKEVILACNSYSGIPGTESAKGLSRAERKAAGKPGALIGIVYLSSFVAPVGSSINQLMEGRMPEATMTATTYLSLDPKNDGEYVFADLDAASKTHYANQLQKQSSATFDDRLTYAGYLHIPTTYLHSSTDVVIPLEMQTQMVDAADENGAGFTRKFIASDHVPQISHSEEVAETLLEAAERGIKDE